MRFNITHKYLNSKSYVQTMKFSEQGSIQLPCLRDKNKDDISIT